MRNLHIVGPAAPPSPLIERGVEIDALRAAVRAGSGLDDHDTAVMNRGLEGLKLGGALDQARLSGGRSDEL